MKNTTINFLLENSIENCKKHLEKNHQTLLDINNQKIANGDFIYKDNLNKINEIDSLTKNFFMIHEKFLACVYELNFEKIQNYSVNLISAIPNKILNEVKKELNGNNPIKFQKQLLKIELMMQKKKDAIQYYKAAYFIKFQEFYDLMKAKIRQCWIEIEKLMKKFAKLLDDSNNFQQFLVLHFKKYDFSFYFVIKNKLEKSLKLRKNIKKISIKYPKKIRIF